MLHYLRKQHEMQTSYFLDSVMDYTIDNSVQFYGVIKNARHIVRLMKAINIKNTVVCFIHGEGVMLTVEDSRSVKVLAYLRIHLFHEFRLNGTDIAPFALPIDSFTNCLQATVPQRSDSEFAVKANDDYCEIKYDGTGSYLTLRRHINSRANMPQTILCNLTPYEPDEENPELQIGDSTEEVPQKMIIKRVNERLG
ncbi:repair protein Rad1/Rec1/Rad17-domain-containing protein [Choanephora cucurbitarum]|nr:repair protein Rad1/Rec1/Rad17-domain-containing protein [Choanephora cucurbitarum]